MSQFPNADAANKQLVKAIPTAVNGLVTKWDCEVTYSLNGVKKTYSDEINGNEFPFDPKPVADFTKAEIEEQIEWNQHDRVFDSQYDSLTTSDPAVKDNSFDVNSLL